MSGHRSIGVMTSADFINWSAPQLIQTNQATEHLYTAAIVQCPGAPHILLGLPMRYDPGSSYYNASYPGNVGRTDAIFMASHDPDGIVWYRNSLDTWFGPRDTTREEPSSRTRIVFPSSVRSPSSSAGFPFSFCRKSPTVTSSPSPYFCMRPPALWEFALRTQPSVCQYRSHSTI